MDETQRSAGQRLGGLALLAGALVLAGFNLRFALLFPQGCPTLTLPLIGLLTGLGAVWWRWQLAVFVFLAPLIYRLPSMAAGQRLRLVGMLLPFVLLFWGVRLLKSTAQPSALPRLSRLLVLYVLLVLLSSVLALWRYLPLWSAATLENVTSQLSWVNLALVLNLLNPTYLIVDETLTYIAGPLLLLLLHSADTALLARLRIAMLCSAAIAAAAGVQQWLTGVQLSMVHGHFWRVYGTLGDANTFGTYLSTVFPLMVAAVIVRGWPETSSGESAAPFTRLLRAATFLAALLIALALYWTQSRAALVAVALVVLVRGREFLRVVSQRREGTGLPTRWMHRRYIRIGIAAIALVLMTTLATYEWGRSFRYYDRDSPLETVRTLFNPGALQFETGIRWMFWDPAIRMGLNPPLTGVGPGGYRLYSNQYWSGNEYLHVIGDPHNYYLKPLAELGLPGFGIFLWICCSVWQGCRQSRRDAAWTDEDVYRLGASAGLLALATNMLLQHPLSVVEMQVIAALMVALAVRGAREGSIEGEAAARPWFAWTAGFVIVVGMIWSSWHTRDPDPVAALAAGRSAVGATATESHAAVAKTEKWSTTVDLQLGLALVSIEVRPMSAAEVSGNVGLHINGDRIPLSTTASTTSREYRAVVYTRPGPSRIALKAANVEVVRLVVIQGHRAVAFAYKDFPALKSALTSLPVKYLELEPEITTHRN